MKTVRRPRRRRLPANSDRNRVVVRTTWAAPIRLGVCTSSAAALIASIWFRGGNGVADRAFSTRGGMRVARTRQNSVTWTWYASAYRSDDQLRCVAACAEFPPHLRPERERLISFIAHSTEQLVKPFALQREAVIVDSDQGLRTCQHSCRLSIAPRSHSRSRWHSDASIGASRRSS